MTLQSDLTAEPSSGLLCGFDLERFFILRQFGTQRGAGLPDTLPVRSASPGRSGEFAAWDRRTF